MEGGTKANTNASVSASQKQTELISGDGQSGNRANLNYLDQLSKFHSQSGSSLSRFPCVDKRPLDLYRLKKAVEIRGGFQKVCKFKKWAEIGRDLGYSGKIMSSLSTSLKNSYQRYLHPYEEWVKQAKPGLQALDLEYNTLSSGPLPLQGVLKDRFSTSPDSPAQGLYTLNAISTDTDDTDRDTVMGDDTPKSTPAPPVSGFAAIKASGFTAVNCSSSSFTSVNSTPNGVKKEVENGYHTPARKSDSAVSSKNTPELKGGTPLKRTHNVETAENISMANGDDSELGERRSKRLKKGGIS